MGGLLETIYDLMVKPRSAFADIAAARSLPQAALIVLFSNIIASLSFFPETQGAGLFLQVVSAFVMWGFWTAIWHLMAELSGGAGSAKQLMKSLGFICFLQLLLVPLYLLASFWPSSGAFLIGFGACAVTIWSAVLSILALCSAYGISGSKATLIFFSPFLAIIVLIFLLVMIIGSSFMTTASEIFMNPPQF